MGILSDIRAAKDVMRIKKGGLAKLSISQITGLIVNMPDAKKNLPADTFEKVYNLFKELRKCTTPMVVDFNGYIDNAIKIIKRFDAIAPYEKYSGGNELETSFMMEDIRQTAAPKQSSPSLLTIDSIILDEEDKNYVEQIMKGSYTPVSKTDAETVVRIINLFHIAGKAPALSAIDTFIKGLIERDAAMKAPSIILIPFFMSVLNLNGVLGDQESTELSDKYSEMARQRQIKLLTEQGKL